MFVAGSESTIDERALLVVETIIVEDPTGIASGIVLLGAGTTTGMFVVDRAIPTHASA